MKRIEELKRELRELYKENDMEYLLSQILNIPLKNLYSEEILVSEKKEKDIKRIFKKFSQGYPLQYLIKRTYFYDMELYIEEGVFIPRYETETFVLEVINFLKKKKFNPEKILDLGCGSGAIALLLKKFFPNSRVFASDIDKKACEITFRNSKGNKLSINVICGDMFLPFKTKFDLIISNPPYITQNEFKNLPDPVRREPKEALYGGKDGLWFYRRIFREAKEYLEKRGFLALEIHPFLEGKIKKIAEEFRIIKEIHDLNGFKRGLIFNLK